MGVNLNLNGSVCVLDDGEIVYYREEERISHIKFMGKCYETMLEASKKYNPDFIVYTQSNNFLFDAKKYTQAFLLLTHSDRSYGEGKDVIIENSINLKSHHLSHASCALYNSGFDKCGILVMDGAGSITVIDNKPWRETGTIFNTNANTNKFEVVYKNFCAQLGPASTNYNAYEEFCKYRNERQILGLYKPFENQTQQTLPHEFTIVNEHISFGKIFNVLGMEVCGARGCSGKIMGLSAYGKDDPSHPRAFVDGIPKYDIVHAYLQGSVSAEDAAYRVQHDSFEPSCDLIQKTIDLTGHKKICLVGGYFLNCVNNYKYLKRFPDVEFYVEPISHDAGTSIGAAKYIWHKFSRDTTKRPLKSLYLGRQADYLRDLKPNEKELHATPKDIAVLIANKELVAIYQGRAEAGPRALGNRSLMYDPRDPNGRDTVNTLKKREYYRPFAGTVMEEHAHDWFDMATLKSSPFMMYAVECHKDKQSLVPALQHNDGTSRIQTLNREQNPHYYDVINEFYKLTGVPMVLNTSFNLAGDTLVDNMDDAMRTCREGNIKYLYCPEREMLIVINT